MADRDLEYWTVWYPKAAATGLLLARGLIEPATPLGTAGQATLLLHAAPEFITVEVTNTAGRRLAYGQDLKQTQDSPICRLRREGERVRREDLWPGESEIGLLVLLPGGEVGTLKQWWHAADRQEWRWQIELYNSRR